MKRLVLMRHAKTQAHHPNGDHARELLPEGIADARNAGILLREAGLEYALVSTATRARQTFAELGLNLNAEYADVLDDAELDIPVEYLDDLYYAGSDAILSYIAETDPAISGLIVVGHAPSIPALAAQLSYATDHTQADQLQCWFPTATFAEFVFDGQWADLAPFELGHVTLERIHRG